MIRLKILENGADGPGKVQLPRQGLVKNDGLFYGPVNGHREENDQQPWREDSANSLHSC